MILDSLRLMHGELFLFLSYAKSNYSKANYIQLNQSNAVAKNTTLYLIELTFKDFFLHSHLAREGPIFVC